MSRVPEGKVRPPFDPEATYTARRSPRFELVREELEIADKLYSAALEGVSPTASPEERDEALRDLLRKDPEMFVLWERLEELMAANDESAILALAALADEEAESGEG